MKMIIAKEDRRDRISSSSNGRKIPLFCFKPSPKQNDLEQSLEEQDLDFEEM